MDPFRDRVKDLYTWDLSYESPVDADGGDFRYEAGDIFDTVNKDVESVSTAAQIF